MELIPYNSSLKEEWNSTVEMSKNGTFLFNRSFMEYHSDRFEDCSLMFFDKKRCIACLPANIDRAGQTVYSHQGLTYGGFVMLPRVTGGQLLEMFFFCILRFLKQTGKAYYRIERGTYLMTHIRKKSRF